MKELSIEEKAKRYDNLLVRLQEAKVDNDVCDERYCCVINDIVPELKEPELAESEDEKVRKEIRDFICWATDRGCITKEQVEKSNSWLAWLEKQREQKPADEIEPKFKVGDWIVSKTSNLVYRVDSILFPQSKCYLLSHNGGTVLVNFADEQNYRLWTIEDAKDGDVLVDRYGNIGIFEKTFWFDWHSYCYLGCNGDFMYDEIGGSHDLIDTYPATKEQRDLLFQKMKEAGYEWDAEKKDEVKINRIVACLENLNVADNDILLKDISWLKSLKERGQKKQQH